MASTQPISERLHLKQDEILHQWEARALKEVAATRGHTSPVLRNSLPLFLNSLAKALATGIRTTAQIDFDAAEIYGHSQAHGRSRAGIPAYVMSQVIFEYHILREVIFEVLEAGHPMNSSDRDIIHTIIEEAVSVAATEFTLALSEAQDQFFTSITHDLRTPVTAAKMKAELIRRAPHSAQVFQLSEGLIQDLSSMTRMIEDILDTSQVQAGQLFTFPRVDCDLHAIVGAVVKPLNQIYGNSIEVRSSGPTIGKWNPDYLRRVIENLLNNAVKFRSQNTLIRISISQTEDKAKFEVHNQGDVISPEDQITIFDRFKRKDKSALHQGWGLGLTFVKGVVDALQGSVRVESTAASGTTFIVELPKEFSAS